MTNKKKSFLLHIDSLDILDDLTDEQAGLLFKAIKSHQKEEPVELDQIVKMVFLPFKNQFDRDNEKYLKTCEKRAESGAIGGRATRREQGLDNKGESQLYVLRLYNEDEDFIKVGTTTSKINRRFSGSKNMPYEYEIIHQLIGEDTDLEVAIQQHLIDFSYSPRVRFPGHTECFSRDCLNKLKGFQPFAQAKSSKPKQDLANVADSDNKNKNKTNNKSDNKVNNIHQQIADSWNEIFKDELSMVSKVTQKRKSAINGCIKEMTGTGNDFSKLETWAGLFEYAKKSDFLMGRKTDWSMSFDFIITKSKLIKLIEGDYENAPATA